jgi:peptidoglycan/xylan/chitin deacetylase (PgdA/CDA1 family)
MKKEKVDEDIRPNVSCSGIRVYRKMILIAFCGLALISCQQSSKQSMKLKGTIDNDSASVKSKASENLKQTMNTAAQIYARPEIPILCYHGIKEGGSKSDYKISPATFTNHMKILADSGYHSISPAQLYDYLVYNKSLPEKPVMITFDDSRIEHFSTAAPIMRKYGFRGVFFIMTITYNKKNYMTTDQIAELAKLGNTIGLHTWDHTMVTKYKIAEDWQKEIADPQKKLEKIAGRPVEYFAYPNGVFNHQSAEELSKYMKISFSLSTKRDSLLPLQTVRRIIVPECTPQGLLKSMRRNFGKHSA